MAPKVVDPQVRIVDLLEKLLIVNMYVAGAPKGKIAKAASKRAEWVGEFLNSIPKGGSTDGKGNGRKK